MATKLKQYFSSNNVIFSLKEREYLFNIVNSSNGTKNAIEIILYFVFQKESKPSEEIIALYTIREHIELSLSIFNKIEKQKL